MLSQVRTITFVTDRVTGFRESPCRTVAVHDKDLKNEYLTAMRMKSVSQGVSTLQQQAIDETLRHTLLQLLARLPNAKMLCPDDCLSQCILINHKLQ